MSDEKLYTQADLDAAVAKAHPDAVEEWLGIPAATLSALRSGEMVAVPRELTEAILKAFREAEARAATSGKPVNSIREMNDDLCREAWPAMLAAAKDARHE